MAEPTVDAVALDGPRLSGLALAYHLEEQVSLDAGAAERHIERWTVSVLAECPSLDQGRLQIGEARVLVFNLESGSDIRDLADSASGTWIDVDTRRSQARLPDAPSAGGGSTVGHVLLLDRVWLHPDYRGQGLGPIVAAAVIERLGRACHLAACYPAPFEGPAQTPDDRERAVEALAKLWSKVGFSPWRDGVWMLDLKSNDVHTTLLKLLAARQQRRPTRRTGPNQPPNGATCGSSESRRSSAS